VEEGDVIVVSRLEGGAVTVSGPPGPQQASGQPPTSTHEASGTSSLPTNIDWGSIEIPSSSDASRPSRVASSSRQRQTTRDPDDPETIRQHFLNNPYELSRLKQQNPPLAEALLSGDRERFRDAIKRHRRAVRDAERERIRMINADPFDPTYQAKIAQDIRQKNIEENMEAALEFAPESFSHVVMLYLPMKVNGVPVKALVDSGARSTVMSQACAERCNIMRLVDRRYAGMAFGVGQQRILGRVHLGQLQIGGDFLTSSFTVLETAPEDMLLGLDMLKRHQCCIDLKENCLRIGTTGKSAAFLTEMDLKEKEDLAKKQAEAFSEKEDFEMAQALAASEQTETSKEDPFSDSKPTTSAHQTPPPHPSPISQPSRPPPSHTQSSTFPEEAILQITSMGFSRQEAVRELSRTNGNVQLALAALLARSLSL
jgi:DNA damage-inducible protein 1